jgi:hypothetical protein
MAVTMKAAPIASVRSKAKESRITVTEPSPTVFGSKVLNR